MAVIVAYKNRGVTKDITIKKGDGSNIVPQENDKVRAVIGHSGALQSDLSGAKLSVDSDSATSNGSSFTKNGGGQGLNRLRLDASDLDFDPGVYTLFVDYFDNADAQEWKNADRHVFSLHETE